VRRTRGEGQPGQARRRGEGDRERGKLPGCHGQLPGQQRQHDRVSTSGAEPGDHGRGRGAARPGGQPAGEAASGGDAIYIAALLIVSGEAWLFLSADLLVYAAVLAAAFQLFVTCYEEPTLRARFGDQYEAYLRTVRRWLPRSPHLS
jgi:hypothetical protein